MTMSNMQKSPSHRVIKFGYYGLIIFVVTALLMCFTLLFVPIIVSILLSLLLEPIINYLETKGVKRLTVIAAMYGLTLAGLVIFVMFVFPKIVTEAQNLANDLPKYKMSLTNSLVEIRQTLQHKFPEFDIPDFVLLIKQQLQGKSGIKVDVLIKNLSSFFALLSLFVIVPIVTFFLLVDGHCINKSLIKLIPNCYFEMTVLLIHKVTSALKFFIRGQMIDAAAVGIMTAIGLGIIGVPYFLVIGLVAGMGNLIPYLGPIIGFIPALLVVGLGQGGITLWSITPIIIVFLIVQIIEGTFIYPVAVGKSVDLHPLLVILGVTFGGQIGGVIGMLISIPLISIIKVICEELHSYLKSYSII